MTQPSSAASGLAGAVRAVVADMLPAPMDAFGTVDLVRLSPDRAPLTVTVSGPTEYPLICRRWSATFDAELRSEGRALEGRQVHLMWSDGQAVIAWSIVTGEADADGGS